MRVRLSHLLLVVAPPLFGLSTLTYTLCDLLPCRLLQIVETISVRDVSVSLSAVPRDSARARSTPVAASCHVVASPSSPAIDRESAEEGPSRASRILAAAIAREPNSDSNRTQSTARLHCADFDVGDISTLAEANGVVSYSSKSLDCDRLPTAAPECIRCLSFCSSLSLDPSSSFFPSMCVFIRLLELRLDEKATSTERDNGHKTGRGTRQDRNW